MNTTRGNIALLTKSDNPDEKLVKFCDKGQYILHSYTKIDALIAGVKSRKYLTVILEADYPNLFDIKNPSGDNLITVLERDLLVPVTVSVPEDEVLKATVNVLGISRTIPKPLFREEPLVAVLVNLVIPTKKDTGIFEDDYCGLFIDDFLYLKYCPFDIYCRLSETKALKVVNAYDIINTELLQRLKDKGMSRLFLKRQDYKKLIAINAYSDNKGLEGKERLAWINSISHSLLDDVYHDDINVETFFAAKQIVENTLDLVADNSMMFELIKSLNELNNDIYKHSLGMSVYSVLIASKMGMNDPKIKFRLSMSGMFADIGLKQIPPELHDKSRILYNHKEQLEYMKHPDLSVDILRAVEGLPEEILQVISQHHESMDGSGFPRRYTKNQIHPLAKIIRVADEFCFLTLRTKHNKNIMSPIKALEEFRKPYNHTRFDKDVVSALETLLLEKTTLKKSA